MFDGRDGLAKGLTIAGSRETPAVLFPEVVETHPQPTWSCLGKSWTWCPFRKVRKDHRVFVAACRHITEPPCEFSYLNEILNLWG